MKARARFPFFVLDLIRAVVVVVPGCEPERGYAKFLQVREAVNYSLEVAAVIVELVFAVIDSARLRRIVVTRVAI